MTNQPVKKALLIGSTLLVFWVLVFSYLRFSTYKPIENPEKPKVKGSSTYSVLTDLPSIPDSLELSSRKSPENGYINIKTDLDPNAVQKFYINVLTGNDWKLKNGTKEAKLHKTEFTKGKYSIEVQASRDEPNQKTIVSVQYQKN